MIEVHSKYKNLMVQVNQRVIHFRNGIAMVTPEEAKFLIQREGYTLKEETCPSPSLDRSIPKPDRSSEIIFSISIICFNSVEITKVCVERILDSLKHNYELIITDNASTDGTSRYLSELEKTQPNITVIRNQKNEGFILPNINALSIAKGKFFILLNNDMFMEDPLWLESIYSEFEANPSVKIIGPVGGKLNPDGSGRVNNENYDYIEGSCLAIPTEFAREIGLFDTSLYQFAYSEDSDLNLRVREMGYSIKRVSIKHTHQQGTTTKKNLDFIRPLANRNREKFYKRWEIYLTRKIFREPLFLDQLYPFDKARFLKSKKILLAREVGLGDVLFFSTVASWMKKSNSKCKIVFATKDEHHRILKDHPHIDEVVSYTKIEDNVFLNTFDYGLHFVPFYRSTQLVKIDELRDHSIEIIQNFFKVKKWDSTLYYSVSSEERSWASDRLINRGSKKVVSIVLSSQDRKRDHPYILDIAKIFREKNSYVVLLNKKRVEVSDPEILNLSGRTSIAEASAIIEQSDLVITPDTGLMHIAGALNKNILTWCTSFPSEVRMKFYKNYYAFELWESCKYGPCKFSYDHACEDKVCYKIVPPIVFYEKARSLRFI